jgi:VWFA-related protein
VREDGDPQKVLSLRPVGTSPLALAVLIQDDVVSSIANEIKPIGEFIRHLPKGSRVMVGYIRSGALEVRQKFTTDTERAAESLRAPVGSASAAPFNPYVEVSEALKRFESLPTGRRAMLVVSDGLDLRSGLDSTSPAQSVDLQHAIREAQRTGVAIYSIYAPTVTVTGLSNSFLALDGQSSLALLSDETGGRSFYHGTSAPVSFDPFLKELAGTFTRQIALTYLSTHPNKGFHRIDITSDINDLEIDHPAGYTR